MDYRDYIVPPSVLKTEQWQLGSCFVEDIPEHGIALLFLSDYRGHYGNAESLNFKNIRKELYRLSNVELDIPVFDFGDLVSGTEHQETHFILQEILSACHYKKTIPIVIGGSCDFSYSMFYALNFHQKNTNYTHISNVISLKNNGEEIRENNFLSKIFSSKNFSINNFHLLGYQKHLNNEDSLKTLQQVDFDILRLADMMGQTARAEPFLRHSDLVTINCDAVESFGAPFSVHPQVNGLNRREICAVMKEIGLSKNLKSVGIFNFDFETNDLLNNQLLSQMIWYLMEGINIRKSHPKDERYDTFLIMVDQETYTFKRGSFTGLWYFGDAESIEECLPCSQQDFDEAKKGFLNPRLLK